MPEFARVRLESGAEVTVSKPFAESHNLDVLDKPATDRFRRPLLAKYPVDLRGQELEAALEAAGLPKGGTAAEKRQRLADHQEAGGNVVGATTNGGESATTS